MNDDIPELPSDAETLTKAQAPLWLRAIEWITAPAILIYCFGDWRNSVSDFSVFAFAALVILVLQKQLLPPPLEVKPIRRAHWLLCILTTVAAALMWGCGWSRGHLTPTRAREALIILVIYLPFGWLQHFPFQRYIVQKFCLPAGRGNRAVSCFFAGLIFSALHWPFPTLLLPTFFGGVAASWYYLDSGRILPIAAFHGLLGTSYIYWVLNYDPFQELAWFLG